MPQVPIDPILDDLKVHKNFTVLRELLNGGLGIDNFNYLVIEGTTSDTPDSEMLIPHSMKPQPSDWKMLIGDVYVQNIYKDTIDVRSTKKNVFFKIIVFGGPKVVDETASNPDDYVSTEELIDSKVPPLPLDGFQFNYYVGHTIPGPILQALADENYVYMTVASSGLLYRMNKETGAVDSLDLAFASNAYAGPMCFDTDAKLLLWVCESIPANGGVGSAPITAKSVLLSSFSINSTVDNIGLAAGSTNVSVLVSADERLYIGYRNNTGSDLIRVASNLKTGGTSGTAVDLVVDATAAGLNSSTTDLVRANGFFYAVGTVDTNAVYKIAPNLGSVITTTQITPQNSRILRKIAVYNNTIYGIFTQITGSVSTGGYYVNTILQYDLSNDTFDIATPIGSFSGLQIDNFLIDNDGFAWMVSPGSTTNGTSQLIQIIRINLSDGSQDSLYYPFPGIPAYATTTNGSGIFPASKNNCLVLDHDGRVMVIGQSTTGGTGNLLYFYPDFSSQDEEDEEEVA